MGKTIKLDKDLDAGDSYSMPPTGPSHYPEFSFSEDEPCDLPDEGELTIKYRLVRHSTDTTNEDKPKYSYTVSVQKLVSARGEHGAPTKKYDEAGEALDALVKEKGEEY